jgi:hypothetical protein
MKIRFEMYERHVSSRLPFIFPRTLYSTNCTGTKMAWGVVWKDVRLKNSRMGLYVAFSAGGGRYDFRIFPLQTFRVVLKFLTAINLSVFIERPFFPYAPLPLTFYWGYLSCP